MKRIIRRIVTVVTTETWSVVEDEEGKEHELADYSSQLSLTEQSSSRTPASPDEAHEETETEVSDREDDQEKGGKIR